MSLLLPPPSSPAGPNELAACDDLPPGWAGERGAGGVRSAGKQSAIQTSTSPHPTGRRIPDENLSPIRGLPPTPPSSHGIRAERLLRRRRRDFGSSIRPILGF